MATVDGNWHHLCLSWRNTDGAYKLYINGSLHYQGVRDIGHVIPKGAIVLGQEADSYIGSFSSSQSFQGNLTGFNLWNRVLSAQEVSDLAKCKASAGQGNIVTWTDLKDKGEGATEKIIIDFCCHGKNIFF